MITEEVIQRVQSQYSKGVQSDDSRLMSRHIYNKLMTVRSKLITQQSDKKQKSSQWNYQTICIPVIEAELHECAGIPTVGCKIYRSKKSIPDILTDNKKHLIQSVTSLDGSIVFSEITWTEKKYKAFRKYTSQAPDYFFRNEFIYFTSSKPPKVIVLTALFEDPISADNFSACCEDCDDCISPLEIEFPLDGPLLDTLIEMASQELIDKFNSNREDLRNDTKNNTPEQTL